MSWLSPLLGVLLLGLGRRFWLAADPPPPGEPSDEELFSAYRHGRTDAFDTLWRRYAPAMTRLMRRQVRREEHAAELVQQTFLQLHRARLDFREGALLRPWLYTIALNLRREYFRKKSRSRESAVELAPESPLLPRVAPDDGTDLETARQVHEALARLPEGQRTVIQLHWFHGLAFAEVAEVVGASVSAVKVRAHRGYKVLRGHLQVTDAPEGIGLQGGSASGGPR